MDVGTAEIHVNVQPDELVRVLRVLAKHANACADELAGVPSGADEPEPEAVDLDVVKRERAERHKRLGGKTPESGRPTRS